MDGDRILGFPDVCQKTGVRDLIDSALVVEEHIATIDSSSGAAVLHKYVLALVEILSFFFGNSRVHLLRFLGFLLGALRCKMALLPTFVTFYFVLPVVVVSLGEHSPFIGPSSSFLLVSIPPGWRLICIQELLDGFHDVIASRIVLLDIILNTLQRLAELCWVAQCSYVEDFVLQLCYFTFIIGFSRLISSVVEPIPVLFSGKFRRLRLLFCHSSDN